MFTKRGMTEHVAWARTRPDVDVLFLHGFSDSADCWAPVLPALADSWGCLATDARGHGRSGLPPGPADNHAAASDAALALAAQPSVDGRAVFVVGHSMGAITGATLAASYPQLVRGLVLEDPPFFTRTPENAPDATDPAPAADRFNWLWEARALDLPARIAKCRSDQPAWSEAEIEPWAISKEQFNPEFAQRRTEPAILTELLPGVRCPVLLIYGDPDRGSMNSRETAEACAQACGGPFQAVRIEGTGHNVRRDRPGPYLDALTAFLSAT